jgi:hypothetical protein
MAGNVTKAYAATYFGGEGVNPSSVRFYARDVRKWVGEMFAHEGESTETGWRKARKHGVRIVRVRIEVVSKENPHV